MENKVEAVKDGQEQGLSNTTTIKPSEETKTDGGTQPKLVKDVPELKESKLNCSNGTDASANNGGPITSPLGNPDVLDNGFLADKSPCTIGNHEAVNGKPKSIGNGDAASMHVDEKDLFAPDTMQPESAAKESVDLSLDPGKTGHANEPQCDSSPRANLIIKSSEDVAPVISSEHHEQTMTALLKEAVQDEIVLSDNLVSPDKVSAHNTGELSQSPDASKTKLFKAAIEEFSRGGGIPASLLDLQSDETAMSKSKLKGEAFQKLLKTFDDQLQKAFGEEKATSLKQSGEASMKDKNETSVGNVNLIPEGPGSVLPEKNNLTSEC